MGCMDNNNVLLLLVSYPAFLDDYAEWLIKRKEAGYKLIKLHKASEPYRFKIKDDDLKHMQELLSCTTCRFLNEEAYQTGQPWCNSPHPPDIQDNYCYTFEPQR